MHEQMILLNTLSLNKWFFWIGYNTFFEFFILLNARIKSFFALSFNNWGFKDICQLR